MYICNACWDSLSALVHAWVACLASLACDWLVFEWYTFKCVHCKLCCDWFRAWMINYIVKHLHALLIDNYGIAHSVLGWLVAGNKA